MGRLELTDTGESAALKMSGGIPGALVVCGKLFKEAHVIDPDAGLGAIGVLMDLDERGIYEDRIWSLFSEVCGRDLVKMMTLLRADQLGQLGGIDTNVINRAMAEESGEAIDFEAALAAVRKRLPMFAAESKEQTP
jgi:hypothetical protein